MRLLALMLSMLLVSCQAYDFERVEPLFVSQKVEKTIIARKRLKPNVMLLVDNSGSMLLPTDSSDPDCRVSNGQNMTVLCGSAGAPCPAACPTRVSELKSAMGTFLQTSGTVARLGLTVFPTPGTGDNGLLGCDPSTGVAVGLPLPTPDDEGTEAVLSAKALEANAAIQGLSPLGGTPTAASIDFVGTYRGLNESTEALNDFRDDFVLLLTDGLPNCNGANSNAVCGGPVAACECTTGSCTGSDPVRSTCSKGCLDRDVAVEKVKQLKQKNIRTIVVGFGADLASGSGPAVLNAMAWEGGFPRECPEGSDLECGGTPGSCNVATKQCSTSFYQAANGDELAQALRKISEGFTREPCAFLLPSRPSDQRYLAVLVDEQSLSESTATYDYDFDANRVTFLGNVCERIKASTPQRTVSVEFRIVERF